MNWKYQYTFVQFLSLKNTLFLAQSPGSRDKTTATSISRAQIMPLRGAGHLKVTNSRSGTGNMPDGPAKEVIKDPGLTERNKSQSKRLFFTTLVYQCEHE